MRISSREDLRRWISADRRDQPVREYASSPIYRFPVMALRGLVRTVGVVFRRAGVSAPGEATMAPFAGATS